MYGVMEMLCIRQNHVLIMIIYVSIYHLVLTSYYSDVSRPICPFAATPSRTSIYAATLTVLTLLLAVSSILAGNIRRVHQVSTETPIFRNPQARVGKLMLYVETVTVHAFLLRIATMAVQYDSDSVRERSRSTEVIGCRVGRR